MCGLAVFGLAQAVPPVTVAMGETENYTESWYLFPWLDFCPHLSSLPHPSPSSFPLADTCYTLHLL